MEVLELRTYRDLQYVRSMETLMRSLDARLRAADGSLSAKSFQVGRSGSGQGPREELGSATVSSESGVVVSGKDQGRLGSRVECGPNVKGQVCIKDEGWVKG